MLNNIDKIRVQNRANAIVCYRVPESKVIRRFVPGEVKEIEMGELRQAIQIPGTYRLIESNLIIHNKEAADELDETRKAFQESSEELKNLLI